MIAPQSTCAALLQQIRDLMQLKGENPFKIKAFDKAAGVIENWEGGDTHLKGRALAGTLTQIPGVGQGISAVLSEFLLKGTSSVRDDLQATLPEGLLELIQVPGLGAKKAQHLIDELEIKSLGELEYACRENRLLKVKGFGEKAQNKILEGVLFLQGTQGQQRLGDVLPHAERLLAQLTRSLPGHAISMTGPLRRHLETLTALDFLIDEGKCESQDLRKRIQNEVDDYSRSVSLTLPVAVHWVSGLNFGFELARTTATSESWKALGTVPNCNTGATEEEIFKSVGLPWIPPECRETGEEIAWAKCGMLPGLLPSNGIRGVFHNHTTRSDGSGTLEEMVLAAKALGYQYIGISDHSRSAFYAQGLSEDTLKVQEREVRALQEKYPEIQIFWGIESDILADGSLDYDDKTLSRFDFVIGSVHSRFQMDRETMTQRMIQAIRNPYIDFVGHLTGRILLGRKGYELDIDKVIQEAKRNDVAIEINAHPSRLDIDWRWGTQLREHGTWVSIHPDAHEVRGLENTSYGVTVARKALLPTTQIVNALSAIEVQKWLNRK